MKKNVRLFRNIYTGEYGDAEGMINKCNTTVVRERKQLSFKSHSRGLQHITFFTS